VNEDIIRFLPKSKHRKNKTTTKMALKLAALLAISTLLSGVHSAIDLTQNHEKVEAKSGDVVDLICSTNNVVAQGCTFRSPKQKSYNMLKGATYEQGRISQRELTPNDCAMKINRVEEKDNGEWECSVTGKGESGDYEVGAGKVQVVVAVPPAEVHLEVEGQQVTGPISLNLDSETQLFVDCVATGARPAAEFAWYIADTKLNANIKVREEAGEDGKMTYTSTLEYNAAPMHSGSLLKCEVNHMGYTMVQIEDRSNVAESQLNLKFKPDNKEATETFYGMKEGEENTVRIKFRANPEPSEGAWKIGEISVPVAAASIDNAFASSGFLKGDLDGEYQVELVFTMTPELAGKKFSFTATNELGSTSYEFDLALSQKPPADDSASTGMPSVANLDESANGPVIGVIILVVIIILIGGVTVIARAKGALCFGGKKKKDEDTEQAVDKEGSDTESAEDTTTGKDETDTKDNVNDEKKDEKKSTASGMVNTFTNLFAAMKKSVKKPKDGKYAAETPESEMKLHENEEKKEGENDNVVYADLDKSALGTGSRRESEENEKTEYAEIRPQK